MSVSHGKGGGPRETSLFKTYLHVAKNSISEGTLDSVKKFGNAARSAHKCGRFNAEELQSLYLEFLKLALAKASEPRFYVERLAEVVYEVFPEASERIGKVVPLYPRSPVESPEQSSIDALSTLCFYLSLSLNNLSGIRLNFSRARHLKEHPPLIVSLDSDSQEAFKHLLNMYLAEGGEEKLVEELNTQTIYVKPVSLLDKMVLLPVSASFIGHMPSIQLSAFQYAMFLGKAKLLQDALSKLPETFLRALFSNLPEYLSNSSIYSVALNVALFRGGVYFNSLLSMLDSLQVCGSGGSKTVLDVALESTPNLLYYLSIMGNTPAISQVHSKLAPAKFEEQMFPVVDGRKRNLLSLLVEKGLASDAQVLYIQFYRDEALRKKMLLEDPAFFYFMPSKSGVLSHDEVAFLNFLLGEACRLDVLNELSTSVRISEGTKLTLKTYVEFLVGMPLNRYLIEKGLVSEPSLKIISSNDPNS